MSSDANGDVSNRFNKEKRPILGVHNLQGNITTLLLLLICLGVFYSNIDGKPKFQFMAFTIMNSYIPNRHGEDAFSKNNINISSSTIDSLNKLGKQGWEIVTCYLEPETSIASFNSNNDNPFLQYTHPIWGYRFKSDCSVPLVRPDRVVLLLQREF